MEQPGCGHRDADEVYDDGACEVLPDDPSRPSRDSHRLRELGQIVAKQHDVGGLARDVGARAHRDPHACLRQCGSVVDPIANHRDDPAARDQLFDSVELGVGQ